MKILCKTVSLILLILNTLRLGALGVAEWQFSGASRLPAPDEVAGIPAAAAGDASRLALREGVQFRNRDAADDCGAYLRIADQPSLTGHDNGKNGLASLNLAVRFRPETIRHAVLLRKTDPGTDFGYQLFLTREGKVALRIRNRDGKTVNVVSRNRVRPGEWNMADATADSARTLYNLQVRLNGVVTRASGAFTPLSDTSGALTVGGLERGPGKSGQYFDGAIASAAVSDVTRALDEPGAVDPAPALNAWSSSIRSRRLRSATPRRSRTSATVNCWRHGSAAPARGTSTSESGRPATPADAGPGRSKPYSGSIGTASITSSGIRCSSATPRESSFYSTSTAARLNIGTAPI